MKRESGICVEQAVSQMAPSRQPGICFARIPSRWPAETAVLIGGGESLLRADVEHARGKARTIAVNDAWRLASWADVLYGADAPWWEYYEGVPSFEGERWTQDKQGGREATERWGREATERWGLNLVRSEPGALVSFDPTFITQGWNSGFQAMNLAVLFGCSRILLLGFDMQGGHWFGNHPDPLNRTSPYPLFMSAFEQAAPQLLKAGIEVVNCSRETALTCFPRSTIDEVL